MTSALRWIPDQVRDDEGLEAIDCGHGFPTLLVCEADMGEAIMLEQDDNEHAVPSDWQETFRLIVDSFLQGDFRFRERPIAKVFPIEPSTAQSIVDNVSAYGDTLAALAPETWARSVYRWMDGHWLFLVDLATSSESVSDLTLHAKLADLPEARLEIQSVHVP